MLLSSQSGWKRAGDLRPGDEVQTIAGRARVEACEFADGAPVWTQLAAAPERAARCSRLRHCSFPPGRTPIRTTPIINIVEHANVVVRELRLVERRQLKQRIAIQR
jgi:hypothetical protein